MVIRRRVTGTKMLEYHRYFGVSERPPFGIEKLGGYGHDKETIGTAVTYEEYKAEVDKASLKSGNNRVATREISQRMGPYQWYAGTGYMGMVLGANSNIHTLIEMPICKEPEYEFVPGRDNVIIGWWYNRQRGIGPGHGVAAWAATKPGYITNGNKYPHYSDGPRIIGINVFEDWEYTGVFPAVWSDYPEVTAATAIDNIIDDYKRIHGIKINNKDFIPREAD